MTNPYTIIKNVGYAVEDIAGTKKITNSADVTYAFGVFPDEANKSVSFPFPETQINKFYAYGSREITSKTGYIDYQEYIFPKFILNHGILFKYFLGSDSGTQYSVKDTNYKDSLTIHFEKESPSGTEPIDLVGSYISRLDWTLEQNKPLIIENMGIRYMKYENSDSSTASVALTNAPTQRSNYIYNGIYSVVWDNGGAGQETLSNVISAKFRSTHEIYGSIANASSGYDAKKQLYPTGTFTHLLQIDLVTSSENQIDNLVNMSEFDIEIICRKTYPDGSKSLTFNIADASIVNITQPITLNLSDFAIQSIQLEYNNLTIDYVEE